MKYPQELSFKDLIALWYPTSTIIDDNGKYIILQKEDGTLVACAEKFNKLPENFGEYFTISKSSRIKNVVTRKMISKKFPEIKFQEREKAPYHQLKQYLENNDCKYPHNYNCQSLYDHIKEMCDGYESLSPQTIMMYNELPGWIWDYSRLTKEGETYELVLDKIENNEILTADDVKIKNLLIRKLENGKLSPYFEKRVRVLGLNV